MGTERMACCGALTKVYSDAGARRHNQDCPTAARRQNYERLYAEYTSLLDAEREARAASDAKQHELLAAIFAMEESGEWNQPNNERQS